MNTHAQHIIVCETDTTTITTIKTAPTTTTTTTTTRTPEPLNTDMNARTDTNTQHPTHLRNIDIKYTTCCSHWSNSDVICFEKKHDLNRQVKQSIKMQRHQKSHHVPEAPQVIFVSLSLGVAGFTSVAFSLALLQLFMPMKIGVLQSNKCLSSSSCGWCCLPSSPSGWCYLSTLSFWMVLRLSSFPFWKCCCSSSLLWVLLLFPFSSWVAPHFTHTPEVGAAASPSWLDGAICSPFIHWEGGGRASLCVKLFIEM